MTERGAKTDPLNSAFLDIEHDYFLTQMEALG
jgi:hypothetical protein